MLASSIPCAAASGFTEVTADLEAGMFTSVLPFDEPFVITGQVPTGITALELRCWKLETRKVKGERQPVLLDAEDLAKLPEGNCPRWGGPQVWRNTIDPAQPAPSFRILAPRLDAESTYQFRFSYDKEVTAEEAAAFAAKVREVVDRELWGVVPRSAPRLADLPLRGDLTDEQIKEIRDRLIAALRAVTGADRFPESSRTNIFYPSAPFAEVRNELTTILQPVRQDQSKITDFLTSYQNEVSQTNAMLAALRADDDLARLKAGLTTLTASASTFQPQLDKVTDVLGLADLPQLAAADRESAATLRAFLSSAATRVADMVAKLEALQGFLAAELVANDGTPTPILERLEAAGSVTRTDAARLVEMAPLRAGAVGKVVRAGPRLTSILTNLGSFLDGRDQAIKTVAEEYRTKVQGMVVIAGSTTGDFATQHKNYVSADTGIAYAPELDEFPVYAGTNIYFRPVNKNAALNQLGNFRETFGRRAALTLGLTVKGVADADRGLQQTRDDLFNSQSLILGFGLRLTTSLRLTGGALVFLEKDPDPLVNSDSVAVTPFLSLSFDIDVAPTLGGIGGLFTPGPGG